MKTLLVTILLSLSSFYSYSQNSEQWVARFNGTGNISDAVNKTKVDRFGNIYVSGYTNSDGGNIDFCLLKYNSAGILQWSRTYDNFNHTTDDCYYMTIDDAGNIYQSGISDTGMVTIKYNSAGDFLWLKDFGGLVIGGKNEDLYICGESSNHLTVKKFSSSGTLLWENSNSSPGTYALDAALDQSGNIFLTGGITRDSSNEIGTWKYDISGNLIWEVFYKYSVRAYYRGVFVKTDALGNTYVAGESTSLGLTDCDFVTLKYNSEGEQLWATLYKGNEYNSQYIRGMAVDAGQNIYITGESSSDYATIKYNSNGEQQWCAIYNGEANKRDEVYGIGVDGASNVYVTGWSQAEESMNCVTIKYNTYGVQQWKQAYHGPVSGVNCTNSIAVDSTGNVYAAGFSEGDGTQADIILIKYGQTTEVNPVSAEIPVKYSLLQNYPNPFNPNTNIEFALPENTYVTLKVFDMAGREIYTLVNEILSPGIYRFNFNGSYLASGAYFYKLQTSKFTETKKMVLVK
ncbi:MAG: SBBP repeat-containing protein [Ignavibacteria bacterium]|nr:SBBP repeat-containing protein [Ignavibacteria bacterium]